MATTLLPGDLAIIGFNFDNPDEFAFLALTDITAGTEIKFTDNGWQANNTFRATEGTFTWTAPNNITAGTVINPTINSVLFSASGDQIIAYQGDDSNPTFIYALNSEGNPGVWQPDATSSNTSALPSGLVNGETAVALDEVDNAVYTGITSGTKQELLAAISDQSNWSGDNSNRQIIPTAPFTVTDGSSNIVINEVYASHTGVDDTEFIEIFGTPGTSLDGLSFIGVEGDSGSPIGTIDARIDFDSTHVIGDNGFFLVGNPIGLPNNYGVTPDFEISSNFLENSSSTFALVETSSLSGNSVTGGEVVIDAVALTDGGAGDTFFFNAPVVGPDGSFFPAGARRVTDGVDTDTVSDWVISDFFLGADNSPTAGIFDNGGGGGEPNLTPIYDIQGAGHTSALEGQTVTTTGIVTAVDSNGFYLQDPTGDGNDATSDAIFVFTSSAPGVSVGDELQVDGTVSEFTPGGISTGNLSTTQLSGAIITNLSSGNALPDAVIIGSGGRVPPTENIDDDAFGIFDPVNDGIDFFESLEGMRVTAQDLLAVSGTNRFGEIFAVVDSGVGATGLSQRGTLNLSPNDFNPEKIQIDEDSGIFDFAFPDVNVGDSLGDVTGVVNYSFGNFEILPTEDFTSNIVSAGLQAESTTIIGDMDTLTIATYNVLNLDPNDSDGDSDIANGRFSTIAQQIVNNLNTPDIIGLQEIQDNNGSVNDGTVAADQTLQLLVDAIAANGGPQYQFIDNTFITNNLSGGQPGGNIRTAFLYDPNRVSVVDGSVESVGTQNPGDTFNGARLPLVARFDFNGEQVTVVNNHFSSKGGSAPILGVEQDFAARQEDPTVNGSLDERREQAQAVNNYVDSILASDANSNVVVLGDLNEFEFVSPLDILAGTTVSVNGGQDIAPGGTPVLTNLIDTLPEDERYSFIFQGNSQQLDHILVSDSLLTDSEVDVVNVNTEFAETNQRASDHDPIIVSLNLQSPQESNPGVVIEGTSGRDNLNGTDGNDTITGFQGRDTVTGGAGDDTFVYTSVVDGGDIITDFEVGNDKIDLAEVLDGVGFAGVDPIADGYVGFGSRGSDTILTIDPDGATGSSGSRSFLLVQDVDAAALNNPDNFIF